MDLTQETKWINLKNILYVKEATSCVRHAREGKTVATENRRVVAGARGVG